ncbi:ABC transporter permease [Halolactibacillus miurensis]|uniref:ABC transporter permease n=1 Tax=Halolactibacillus miurensis TaxID=306541 RepID=A0A1I6P6Y0_9BACI|nr:MULTISPECIES: ABC transporter ATP-binding protein [Halolactibacillus]GEM03079.1 ABC transporter permease [Halolactibacillus miurensis]SFS35953.1 peptide/nickel transport system ATP-binding protein [Halolactibacillus miurensis]
MSVLTTENLSVDFKRMNETHRVVNQINFSIAKGETLGIVGESGSGKSVTAKAVMKLLDEQQTEVAIETLDYNGNDIASLNQKQMTKVRGKEISMIFQDPMSAFNPTMKIGKQLIETARVHLQLSKKEATHRALDMLKKVGIDRVDERFHQYPHEFSGGMLQRAMIAMALICRPKLLIADEPTTALDVRIQAQILKLMKDLQQEIEMSIILITHDFGVVAGMCDRVVVMKDGELVEENDVTSIFNAPKHPYTKKLLEALPRLHEDKVLTKESKNEETLLSVSGLTKVFQLKNGKKLQAVEDVSFDIKRGETLGLVGESGSGKSTTGRLILQLESLTAGSVTYKGMRIHRFNKQERLKLRRDIQIIFQDPKASLNPRMKVMDIIGQPLDVHQLYKDKDARKKRIEELLLLVGLEREHMYRYPHEFSGGQQQRIGIARALAVEPEFIVCDEVLSALDVSIQAQMVELLKDLQEKLGLTYLFIAHDLAMVKHLCDRVAVMYDGKLIELGSSVDVYNQPLHSYTQALIDAVPIPDPGKEREKLHAYQPGKLNFVFDNRWVEKSKGHWVRE